MSLRILIEEVVKQIISSCTWGACK